MTKGNHFRTKSSKGVNMVTKIMNLFGFLANQNTVKIPIGTASQMKIAKELIEDNGIAEIETTKPIKTVYITITIDNNSLFELPLKVNRSFISFESVHKLAGAFR